jgi:hypothetical protein
VLSKTFYLGVVLSFRPNSPKGFVRIDILSRGVPAHGGDI